MLGLVAVASAADLQVGPTRTLSDLQEAVDGALPGDRILVDPGTYGPIVVTTTELQLVSIQLGAAEIEAAEQAAVTVADGTTATLRGFTLDGADLDRALVVSPGAVVTIEDAVLRDGLRTGSGSPYDATGWGGCASVNGAIVALRRTRLTGCTAESGGGLYAHMSTLFLDETTVEGCVATSGFGGGVGADGSTVVVRGGAFTGDLADDPVGDPDNRGLGGGLFVGSLSALDLVGTAFSANVARSTANPEAGRGGALRLWTTDAVVRYAVFSDGHASAYGSGLAAASSTLTLSGTRLERNVVDDAAPDPTYGGSVFCDALSTCAIDRSWFEDNAGADGAGVCSIGDLTVTTSMFCRNTASSDAGAIDAGNLVDPATVTLSGNVMALNHAPAEGGAIVLTDGPSTVRNNHLVGNTAGGGAAIATTEPGALDGLAVVENLIAGNEAVDGPAVELEPVASVENWNAYWANTDGSADVPLGAGSWEGDPGLSGPVASCDPADLAPAAGSPLIDGGSPDDSDADGSPVDIGAFGGPHGDLAAFFDADGDGWAAMLDCDDTVATVFPTAPETCNGVDDDCDELVDGADAATDAAWLHPDGDGDGVGVPTDAQWRCPQEGWSAAADDCDDQDADLAAPVTWYVDADGDGAGDPTAAHHDCSPPDGAVFAAGDCDDADPSVITGCGPLVDSDGDGVPDAIDPAPDDAGGAMGKPPVPDYCGCGSSGPGSAWTALALALLAARRRARWATA